MSEGGEKKTRTVESRFTVNDEFSGAFGRIQSRVGEGAKRFTELRERFRDFRRETGLTTLGALGLGYGIGSWIEKTREANAEFGRLQKQTAGVLAGALKFEKGAGEVDRYTRSLSLARDVMEDQERVAGRFNVGLDDVTQTYRTLVVGAGQLGATQEQITRLTEDAIASQKRFGGAGDQAAKIILRGLQTGRIRAVDPFSASIANAVGNMAKLTRAQRFEHIQRALSGSRQIADQMSTGIDASINRARITVDGLLRDATGPLFREIAGSLDKWAKHLREAREQGKPLVDVFAGKLVGAFHALESASKFIKDHWMAIAGINLGSKLIANAGKLGGMFGGAAAGGEGGALGGMGLFSQRLGIAVTGLSAFATALDLAISAVEHQIDKGRAADERAGMGLGSMRTLLEVGNAQRTRGVLDAKTDAFGRKAVEEMKRYGLISGGKLDRQALAQTVQRLGSDERTKLADQLGIRNKYLPVGQMSAQQFVEPMAKQLEELVTTYAKAAETVTKKAKDDKSLPFAKGQTVINGNVNVKINTENGDPDAIFVRFQQKLHDAVTRPGQAVNAEPAGF